MDLIEEIILSVIPWLRGVVDVAQVKISAIPGGMGGLSIIILAGGLGLLWYYRLIPSFGLRRNEDDDNW